MKFREGFNVKILLLFVVLWLYRNKNIYSKSYIDISYKLVVQMS